MFLFRVFLFNFLVEIVFYFLEDKKKEDKLWDKGWGNFLYGEGIRK